MTFEEVISLMWLSGERRALMERRCFTDSGRRRVHMIYDALDEQALHVETINEPLYKGTK